MCPITSSDYAPTLQSWVNRDADAVDYDGAVMKGMLALDTHVVDPDADDFLNDVEADRVTGSTDQTLASKTNTIDGPNNRVVQDAGDLLFGSVPAGPDAGGVILFDDTGGTPATKRLMCAVGFVGAVTPNGSDISVAFNAAGIRRFNYAL